MRYFASILGLTLVILVLMSLAPAIAGSSKDADREQPSVNEPAREPAPVEQPAREPQKPPEMAPQQPPAEAEEPAEEEDEEGEEEGPAEPCWYMQRMNYISHMDASMMDERALRFMANVHTIAILPFVDLTAPTNQGDTKLAAAGGPRRIVEALAASLMSKGYLVIPPSDAEIFLEQFQETAPVAGEEPVEPVEIQNNRLYFRTVPERALNYHLQQVHGLQEQYETVERQALTDYMTPHKLAQVASGLGANALIRGYVQEYAVERRIDADLRTFLPPFLGLINPERRGTIQVAYYLYDGATGELIWNTTVDVARSAEWPLFQNENDIMEGNEARVVGGVTHRITPNWEDLVWNHPRWIPFDNWHQLGGCMNGQGMGESSGQCMMGEGMGPCTGECMPQGMMGEGMGHGMMGPGMMGGRGMGYGGWGRGEYGRQFRPDWLNPYRFGWHEEYQRGHFHMPCGRVENEPYRFDDLYINYNGIRHHHGGRCAE